MVPCQIQQILEVVQYDICMESLIFRCLWKNQKKKPKIQNSKRRLKVNQKFLTD